MNRSDTDTIIKAMRILSEDIETQDGVANAAIWEAAERLEEMLGLIDGCFEVVEIWKVTTPSQIVWKKQWIERALAVGATREW